MESGHDVSLDSLYEVRLKVKAPAEREGQVWREIE